MRTKIKIKRRTLFILIATVTVTAALSLGLAAGLGAFSPRPKRLKPLFEARADVFAVDQLGGRYTEEPSELKAFAAQLDCAEPTAVITSRYDAVTGIEFKNARDAKRFIKSAEKRSGFCEPRRDANLVFYSAAEDLSGILTGRVFISGGSVYFDGGESLTLVRYGGATESGEKPVTSVAYRAFAGHDAENIALPDTVVAVGREAFFGCVNLKEISVGDACVSLGARAFSQCVSLQSISLPSVAAVGDYCFENAYSLGSVAFGANPDELGDGVFTGCRALSSVTFGGAGKYSFDAENGVLFGDNGATLVRYLPANRAVSYEIPAEVSSLGVGAFELCVNLTSVTTAGAGLKEIPADAFHNCIKLQSAPTASALKIGERAFMSCRRLDTAPFSTELKSVGREAFYGCTVFAPPALSDSVSVGEDAFKGCKESA